MLAIDNADGDKTQVFNPEGTALVIADTIARKEDIFVDDGGQTQYYPFEYQDVSALAGDGFDGVDSLEYRERGFQTNENYFVDNDEGGKTQIVDYQNDPIVSRCFDKHDLFEFSDTSFVNPDDQVYPFEYQDGDLMDGTDIYTMEVRTHKDMAIFMTITHS